MPNIEKEGGLYTEYGQQLRGPIMDANALIEKLKTADSKMCKEAVEYITRARRLLLPIQMMLSYQAMGGDPFPDEAHVFSFMGGGGSDFTFCAEFRALFGDERKELAEYEREAEMASRGECTNLSGCQKWEEHQGSCGYARMEPCGDFPTDLGAADLSGDGSTSDSEVSVPLASENDLLSDPGS